MTAEHHPPGEHRGQHRMRDASDDGNDRQHYRYADEDQQDQDPVERRRQEDPPRLAPHVGALAGRQAAWLARGPRRRRGGRAGQYIHAGAPGWPAWGAIVPQVGAAREGAVKPGDCKRRWTLPSLREPPIGWSRGRYPGVHVMSEPVLREPAGIVRAQRTVEGGGFIVRRPFPTPGMSLVDPFLLLDEMGPVDYAPGEAVGAPDHPHRGFETVTYVLEGEFEHEDSAGHRGELARRRRAVDDRRRGIVHSEMPSRAHPRRRRPRARLPDLGEPAGARQDDGAALPGGAAAKHPEARRRPTARRACEVIAGEALGVQRRDRDAHADPRTRTGRSRRVPSVVLPAPARLQRAASTCSRARRASATHARRRGRQLAILGDGDAVECRAADAKAPARLLAARRRAAARAGRALRPVRDEHRSRDPPGDPRLPERQLRRHPSVEIEDDDPHAHCVRCPHRGSKPPLGGPAGGMTTATLTAFAAPTGGASLPWGGPAGGWT